MSRIATRMRVLFIEEPYFGDTNYFEVTNPKENLWIVVPHLKVGMSPAEIQRHQKEFISRLLFKMSISSYVAWYYTPMALQISDHLNPELIVYDCMDELTAFKFAPQELKDLEKRLLSKADVVFTGGYSLYDAKKHQHKNIHPFPSSIDYDHFFQARTIVDEPEDQARIPHRRFGFYGVIDERMDLALLDSVASLRSDWNIILIGPVVKIDEKDLPRRKNIHYLGMKTYEQLPHYLAGWDVAIMPFAKNESTQFISPTKTPEFLAAGKPVISTSINDVVRQYKDVVHFADSPEEFVSAAEQKIVRDEAWLAKVDGLLKDNSWDKTWKRMEEIMRLALAGNVNKFSTEIREEYV
jgi:UDP-galactopyranose mutase